MLKFRWDPKKDLKNLAKHGIDFEEAATVFGDPLSITLPDPDHSIDEQRYVKVGLSKSARCILVIYTDMGDVIRIISARKVNRKEKRVYEEG